MNKNQIGAVIICEDVRTEINGKQILIGVFTSDIIINNKGAVLVLLYGQNTLLVRLEAILYILDIY